MSGETAHEPSGWTLDSLHSHLLAIINSSDVSHEGERKRIDSILGERDRLYAERDLRYDERFRSLTDYLTERLSAIDHSARDRFNAQEEAVRVAVERADREFHEHLTQVRSETQLALDASEKAIAKSELANEKRFESVNEFRGQLDDQSRTFIPRREAEAMISAVEAKVADSASRIELTATRADLAAQVASAAATVDGINNTYASRHENTTSRITQLSEEIVKLQVFQQRVAGLEQQVITQKEQLAKTANRSELTQQVESFTSLIGGANTSSVQRYDSMAARVGQIAEDVVSLKQAMAHIHGLEALIQAQKERLDKTEGRGAGGQALWGYIVGVVGVMISVIVLVNLLTGSP